MTPEQIEGYLERLDVRYCHDDEPGPHGVFHVRFRTVSDRSKLPPVPMAPRSPGRGFMPVAMTAGVSSKDESSAAALSPKQQTA